MGLLTRYAADDTERARFASMLSWAFGASDEVSRGWLERPGTERVRLGFSDGRLVAGLLEVPMGQWFGGCAVPTLGIAGVAVDAEARGQGHALELMRKTLDDARAAGFALSTLYPAALHLYRQAGYELAGTLCRYEVLLSDLPGTQGELELGTIEQRDQGEIEAVYQAFAKARPGYLDRGAYVWARVRHPDGKPARGVLARSADGIEGYAYLRQVSRPGQSQHDLELSDLVARTPRSLLHLLGYLRRHRSTARSAVWYGATSDPRLLHLPVPAHARVQSHWMLRVVDVQNALVTRGYPPLDARVELYVEDTLLPDNTGRYRLELEDGQTSLERSSGAAEAHLDVDALAPLYAGFVSATALAEAGRLRAAPAALHKLDAIFAGPAPGLADFF